MMRILGDRVLVALEPDPEEVTTASGLVLVRDPDKFRTPTRGIVVALGEKSGTVDINGVAALFDETEPEGQRAYSGQYIREALTQLRPAGFDVTVGDCVVFAPFVGDQFEHGGIEYVVLHEHEVIGVVEPIRKDTAA